MERLAFTALGVVQGGGPRPPGRPQPAPPAVHGAALDSRLGQYDTAAYWGLIAFTIVLFFRPQDTLPFLGLLQVGDLTAGFAVIALLAGRLSRGAPLTRTPPELLAVVAMAAVMLATAPFSVWPGGALDVLTDVYVKVVIIFALMINTLTTRARLDGYVNIVVLGTSYIGVRAVVDYARGVNLVEDGRVTGAVDGLFGNPNDMALTMVAFLPLGIVAALGRGRPVMRAMAFVGVPAMTAAIIFSKSRGGLLGLIAMLLVLLYQFRRIRPGVAVLVIAASLATIPMLPQSFTSRMSSIFNPEEDPTGSREARKVLLREGYEAFLQNPIVGLGAGQFQNHQPDARDGAWRETHNAVLQVASELGIGGLVVFIVLIGSGFAAVFRASSILRRKHSRRRARDVDPSFARRDALKLYTAAMAASLMGWFAAAMFASVAYYWTFYLVLGLAVALRDITVREFQEEAAPRRSRYRPAA
jgi:putative inorganic carbon (hco3(-)) transporter